MTGHPRHRTPRRRGAPALAAAGLAVVVLGACSGTGGGDDDEAGRTLTVFAAASLTEAFTEIADELEQAHPGVTVRLSFDGSSGLVDQIAGGAPADVLATADEQTMARATDAGLVAGAPRVFATNVLTLVTPAGNPAGVTGLDDSLDGTRLVVCAEAVPCGAATRALAARAGVGLEPVSEETGVTDVRGKVASGEADAGIVYATDAAAAGDAVDEIPIAGADASPNRYPIAALADAADADLAADFLDAVTGPPGREVLERHGFGAP
ncbi:MAG TPA: molybdate ABC transporter substrate-binding protein [Actinomycetales bacterium]|nr:molybdate ABC transporter substrate-binding protein [Actinomycetales bacterium]